MLLDCLSAVADPRRAQGQRYQLRYVLLFAILAMLSGATSYRKIQRFIHAHRETLNELFDLDWKRAPAHTSIRTMLQALDEQELEKAFRRHSRQLSTPPASDDAPPVLAIDGKVLRGSVDHFEDQRAAQLLSVFSQADQLILGHLPVSTKTNEIPVAQQLIAELDLGGSLYTFDALHCQKKPSTSSAHKAARRSSK
jgi:hypothetical protein